MSSDALAAFRAQFKQTSGEGGNRERGNNNFYPFWDMKPGERAVVRFIADANKSNPRGFLLEKLTHKLTINGSERTVPCMSMYDEDCPICKVSQGYYKAEDKVLGKRYWRKRQYLAQVLVIEDPLEPNKETGETHQGQVRNMSIGFQLYEIIKEAIASEEDGLEAMPHDVVRGYDFIIKKSTQGEYSTYAMGSKFLSKPRALTDAELTAAEEHAIDLRTLLPKNPSIEKIQSMLNADLNGGSLDDDDSGATPPARQERRETAPVTTSRAPVKSAPVESGGDDEDLEALIATITSRRNSNA